MIELRIEKVRFGKDEPLSLAPLLFEVRLRNAGLEPVDVHDGSDWNQDLPGKLMHGNLSRGELRIRAEGVPEPGGRPYTCAMGVFPDGPPRRMLAPGEAITLHVPCEEDLAPGRYRATVRHSDPAGESEAFAFEVP